VTNKALTRRQLFTLTGGVISVGLLAARNAAGAAAPAGQPKPGGTLRYGTGSNSSELDPHLTGDVAAWQVINQVYEQLLILDEKETPQGYLAEKFEVSPDGLSYTFNLRKGVKFHNGREMTSADVKYSIERIVNPKTAARAVIYFETLKSLYTPDPYTFKMTLSKPYAPMLFALARLETAIVPKEEVEKQGGNLSKMMVGTGPFKFVERIKDVHVKLVKNPDYWKKGLPYLDQILYKPIVDEDIRLTSLKTGEVDIIQDMHPKDAAAVAADKSLALQEVVSTYWPNMAMNCSRKPYSDVKVRQAIHYALDRSKVLQLVAFGKGQLSETMVPPGNPFRLEIPQWKQDKDKAKALLAEAGYPNGFETVYRAMPSTVPLAEVVQAQLKEVGITVKIERIENTTWFADVFPVNKRNYDMSGATHASKIDPDLTMWDILHTRGTKNYTATSIPELDKLLDDGRTITDMAKRKEIYNEAQKIFVEKSGYVTYYLQPLLYASRPQVKNWKGPVSSAEVRFTEVWLDK